MIGLLSDFHPLAEGIVMVRQDHQPLALLGHGNWS